MGNDATPSELAFETIKALRSDLTELKRCQLQYFILSVTATGAIVGFATARGSDALVFAILSPLIFVLPCWTIFFDKATTITRIVGYQRLLEKSLIDGASPRELLLFETALAAFRTAQDRGVLNFTIPRNNASGITAFIGSLLRIRHQYWILSWSSFFALSVLSLLSSLVIFLDDGFGTHGKWVWATAFGFAIGATIYTLVLVHKLVRGNYSYAAMASAWESLAACIRTSEASTTSDPGSEAQGASTIAAARTL